MAGRPTGRDARMWAGELGAVADRLAGLFARAEPRARAVGYRQRAGQGVLGQDVGERQAAALEELPPQEVGVGAERAGSGRPHGTGSCRVGRPHCHPN